MKGLNKMPHETCWLYDFFVPSQFISICSICGNISSLRFHPHGMERNARKDGTSSNPPCFWQNVAKRSENQAAQKCSISYCVRHVKRVLLRRKKVGFEVLLFFFFNGKGGEKNTTTQTWSIIKKDDIRLICHLAGRSEDGIYSWSPIYRPYALYIYLHIYWRIKSAYMPETITVFSKDGVCMAFFAEDFSVGVSSSWYLQLCCFISLPLTTMSLPNFLASRNSRFACFS